MVEHLIGNIEIGLLSTEIWLGEEDECLKLSSPFSGIKHKNSTLKTYVNSFNVPVSLLHSDVLVNILTSYEQNLFLSDKLFMNRSDIDTSVVDYCLSSYEQSLFMSDNIVTSCSIESCIEDIQTVFDSSDDNDSSESDSTFMSDSDSDLSQGNDGTFSDEEMNGSDTNFQFNRLKDGLSFHYTNVDNLLFKLDELKVRIRLVSRDILKITEIYPKMG